MKVYAIGLAAVLLLAQSAVAQEAIPVQAYYLGPPVKSASGSRIVYQGKRALYCSDDPQAIFARSILDSNQSCAEIVTVSVSRPKTVQIIYGGELFTTPTGGKLMPIAGGPVNLYKPGTWAIRGCLQPPRWTGLFYLMAGVIDRDTDTLVVKDMVMNYPITMAPGL